MKMETYKRPNVSPRRYRQLENMEMSIALLLPDDLGEACIVIDMLTNRLRRHIHNERMDGHNGEEAERGSRLVGGSEDGNLVRLRSGTD